MGEVAVDDELLDADGLPTRVVAATEVMLGRPCYEIEFSDGTVIVADAQHQWPTGDGIRTSAQLRCGLDTIVVERSAARYAERRTASAVLTPVLHIAAVRRVHSVPVRCVQVDNPAHLYLAGRGMVPTHNSTLGLDFMRSCSIKHRMASVIFSLEMSKSEIVMRLLSAEAKIKLADMRSGRMNDDDWTRLARRMSEISEAPLYIDDSPNLTMMEIRAKARRLRQKADLRLVVVDYMQLMTSGKKVESRQVEVSEFSAISSCSPRSLRFQWSRSASSTAVPNSAPTRSRCCLTFASRDVSPQPRESCAPTPAPRSRLVSSCGPVSARWCGHWTNSYAWSPGR